MVWVLVVGGGGGFFVGWLRGNRSWACAKASFIILGADLNFCLNSLGDIICWVFGFKIWLRLVMLYVCNLLRYFLANVFCFRKKRAYLVVIKGIE